MTSRPLGWLPPQAVGRAPHVGARTAVAGFAGLREQVLLDHLPPPYDQATVGSCTAQALAAGVEALLPRAGYSAERPDRAALYRREREMIGTTHEDSGAIIADGIAVLSQAGWEREEGEPPGTWGDRWTRPARALSLDAPRLINAEPLDFDIATICTELDAGHPVVVGLQVTEDWRDPNGDVLPEPAGEVIGGHAVLLVGYDLGLRAFRVRNSWGTSWRDGGYAWLPWAWIRAPWCGEVHALRAVRRADGPLPSDDLPDDDSDDAPATPLDALERGILSAMAPRPVAPVAPSARTIAPGIGATIYGDVPRDIERAARAGLIGVCDHLTLHTLADPTDVASAARVRALGCQRVWLGLPANYLSRMDLARGRAAVLSEVQRIARFAVDMGVEVVELNGEGASDGKAPGDWTSAPTDAREGQRLSDLARDILIALRAALDALGARHILIAWTSHDMPGFRLPWGPILSRVDLHGPQHYPAEAGRTVKQRELEARIARSRGRWEALADRGEIPDAAGPYGAAWTPYLQGHGHAVGALVWGLCEAPLVRLWAFPGSWDPVGVEALRLARRLRAEVGHGPDAVERWQRARGLSVDGAVGTATLGSLAS